MFSFESPSESPELTVTPNKGGAEIKTSLSVESLFNQFFPVRSTSSSYPSEGVKSPELTVSPPMTFGRRILSSLEAYGFSSSSFLRSSEESALSNQRHTLNPVAVESALRDLYREQEAAKNNEVIECGIRPSVEDDGRSVKITERELTKPEVQHIENIEHRRTASLNDTERDEILADISAVNTESIISLAIAALHRGKSNSSTLPLPRQRPRSSGPSGAGVTPFPSLDMPPRDRALASSKAALLSEEAPSNLSTQCLPRMSTDPPRLSTESPTTLEKRYLKPKSRATLPFLFGSPTKKRSVEVAPTVTPVATTSNVPLLEVGSGCKVRVPSGPYPSQQSKKKKKNAILRLLRYIFRRPIKVVRKFRAKRKGVSKRFRANVKARKERRKKSKMSKANGAAIVPVAVEEVESVIVPVTVLEESVTDDAPVPEIDAVKAEVDAAKAEMAEVEKIAGDEHVALPEKELAIKAVVDRNVGSDVGSIEEVEDVTVEIHVVDASTCVA